MLKSIIENSVCGQIEAQQHVDCFRLPEDGKNELINLYERATRGPATKRIGKGAQNQQISKHGVEQAMIDGNDGGGATPTYCTLAHLCHIFFGKRIWRAEI